jgi:hypothetical protein
MDTVMPSVSHLEEHTFVRLLFWLLGGGQTGFPVLLDVGSEELNLWGMLDNK